jgi:hypothetical protein
MNTDLNIIALSHKYSSSLIPIKLKIKYSQIMSISTDVVDNSAPGTGTPCYRYRHSNSFASDKELVPVSVLRNGTDSLSESAFRMWIRIRNAVLRILICILMQKNPKLIDRSKLI